ncbi:MAG: AAA family ATPase [Planctomycetaceae bacterium]|nr:AAA family ATPase [Planctomycetaceae bacterium]MCA9179386.1 AAA family ATPase [Planctomycetales bacterium]
MSDRGEDAKLANLLARINNLTTQTGAKAAAAPSAPAPTPQTPRVAVEDLPVKAPPQPVQPPKNLQQDVPTDEFLPTAPTSISGTGFTDSEIEALVLKFLLARGSGTGRQIADQISLPFMILEDMFLALKSEQLVVYRGSAAMNDYVYQLTDLGRERAKRHQQNCTYFGACPVTLEDYCSGVKAQSLTKLHPTQEDLKYAFRDLLVNPRMFARLGPAINSGKGMFLYGYPGNGKTSIAKRVTMAFGSTVWIPRALGVDGDIIRVYDPMNHELAPLPETEGLITNNIDRRWVRIKRPTIVVGGELTMDHLEVSHNEATGICEAPLQMKSNCGTLVIDDFGRQRISTDELLNRWIVPLEERHDFLNLPSGKSIQVPFDQLIVFSTNLEPKDLVDEAFLRRIPYKIEVIDPSEPEFRKLFELMCRSLKFEYREDVITYLIEHHYKKAGRNFRACHPRDLLLQIRNHCLYSRQKLELTPQNFDFAVDNYFAVM